MRRIFFTLVVLFVIYFGIQISFNFFKKGHTIEYSINNNDKTFNINEIFTTNQKNETNNYYLTLSIENSKFYVQVPDNFNKQEQIIEDVKYYHDGTYECMLPIFKGNKILLDIMCLKDNQITYYHNLTNKSNSLITFATSIDNYDISKWTTDDITAVSKESTVSVYDTNIVDNHYVAITSYKGLYIINTSTALKKITEVTLFNNDVYERSISAYYDHYYVTADYNQEYKFKDFLIVDLKTQKQYKTSYYDSLSFTSYIQGYVDNSFYVFDPTTRIQYEIDLKTMTMIKAGDATTGIKYYDGEWSTIEASLASKEKLLFKEQQDYTDSTYLKIDKVGNEKSGYYYLYKQNGSKYDVYRSNIMDKEQVTYLFSTTNPNNIIYLNNYIYYIENNNVKYYNDLVGIRTLLTNTEFAFNNNIKISACK